MIGVAGHRQRCAGELAHQPRCCQVKFLPIVDQRMGEPLGERRPSGDRSQRVAEQIAGIASPCLGEHPFMGPVDLGELLLDRVRPGRPRCVLLGTDQLRLQPVDLAHESSDQRGRAAAEVVVTDRELVDPLDQHREPIAGSERIGAAEQPRRQRLRGLDRELVIALRQCHLEAAPQQLDARCRGAHDRDSPRLDRLAHQPQKPRLERTCLARPGPARDDEGTPSMGHRLPLRTDHPVKQ